MQFAAGLSDRQAAEAVRARIDWQYALGLALSDAGVDFSVLSEFRARLVAGGVEQLLLDALLTQCTQCGYLKARGHKVHLTETCDDDLPHLLTQVETTVATETDVVHLAIIHGGLAQTGLLPAQHLVDAGYIRARNLVESRIDYDIDRFGPTYEDRQWQARAGTGYDVAHFHIDWEAAGVTCPQGRRSVRWFPMQTARGRSMIHVAFAPADCLSCSARAQCTRAKRPPRNLTLLSREEHEAMQVARQRQETAEFATQYARRQGIDGTLSQGVRAFGLRRARYRGQAKTHLQQVGTAVAINLRRLADWLNEVPHAQTRCSHFAALALAG